MAAVVAIFFICSSVVEAAEFTQAHIDKMMAFVEQNPASSPESNLTLRMTPSQFRKNFNNELKPVLDQTQFADDEERAIMKKLFLIEGFQIYEGSGGKFYMNVFGNSVAIFGVTGNENPSFKLVSCAYANPEDQGESTMASVILLAFVKVIAPEENPQALLEALAAEQSGTLIRDGVKFSAGKDGDLILFSAVKAAD